ncbi:MAG: CBS domain-containing protein [Solirubrobacteraceae bacterium]
MPEPTVTPSHGSYLLPHLDQATVADAMHPGILSCEADATLEDVARMMSTHHVHCVVVKGPADDPAGGSPVWKIISDLDILRAGMRRDAPDTAADLALQPAVTVRTTDPLRDAAELMLSKSTSHVVAVNPKTEAAVGILSTLDIAGVLAWGEA